MSIITIKWCTCTEAAAPPIIHSAHQNKSSLKDFSNIKSELDLKTLSDQKYVDTSDLKQPLV